MTITSEPSHSEVTEDAKATKATEATKAIKATEATEAETQDDQGQAWPVRRNLAYALVALLAVILVMTAAAMFTDIDLQRIKDVGDIIVTPVAGLVGAVVGFYFGARAGSGTSSSLGGKPKKSPRTLSGGG